MQPFRKDIPISRNRNEEWKLVLAFMLMTFIAVLVAASFL